MKYFYAVLLFFFISTVILGQGWRKGEMEVRINLNTEAECLKLSNMHLDGDVYPGFAIVYLIPSEFEKIKTEGFSYSVIAEDLNKKYENFWMTDDAYHSYQQIVDLADSLAENFPSICTKHLFGTSLQSRQIGALKISDNSVTDEPEAEVMFDGGIHGDEIGGPENCIRFARMLCLQYGNNATITNLVNNREIWIYYMVNPDGRVLMQRENANGVDINRDWGYMWNGEGGSPGAFSQVETKALRSCMYENQFAIHTTYHSGTEFISYPWSYREAPSPDNANVDFVAALYSNTSGYANLPYGQGYSGMYAINGSTKDGNYGMMGSATFTIEISMDKQPPSSQIQYYYSINEPAMLALIEYSGYGIQGTVTDATTGQPVKAAIFVNNFYPSYSDPSVGDFHKFLIPGTYTVKVVANGYVSQTQSGVVVTSNNATTINFQLQPADGQFVHRFAVSQIPNNNPADEGNTPATIGPPDNVYYSIGKNGWCILDMGDPIPDGAGFDLVVHEGDASPEGYTCYASVSMDGPWSNLGTGNSTTEFDLAQAGLQEARFIKIVDDGDGNANVADAGFDLDAIRKKDAVSGVYLALFDYLIDDSNGNNNGKIDPGETVDLVTTIKNNGDITANNVQGIISCSNSYITIVTANGSYGNIGAGQSANATYTLSASASTPAGESITIGLDVTCNGGAYTNNFVMNYVVGQIPVLIVDLDENHNSASEMLSAIQANGFSAEMVTSFPTDPEIYSSIFLCLGIYSDNHILSSSEGQALADFLNAGGSLYMEGGDTWYFDNQTAVHPMFGITASSDGSSDLGTIVGQAGTFTAGMSFSYNGDNSWIDHIGPNGTAFLIFNNQSPSYGTGVAYDAGNYKTIGCSHEFGGLNDGSSPSTQEQLMHEYLDFFGLLTPGIMANFTANTTQICYGGSINFSDMSTGNITSWSWTFEGGTPGTSNIENPVIIYNTAGLYDVTLTVSDGTNTNTITKNDYISVLDVPSVPPTPDGEDLICVNWIPVSVFTTLGSIGATSYIWELSPAGAGAVSGSGTSANVTWNTNPYYTGPASIKVKAVNDCGESVFSDSFDFYCDFCTGQKDMMYSQGLTIIPNPNDGNFTLLLDESGNSVYNISINDLTGKIRYEEKNIVIPQSNGLQLYIPGLQKGLYLLRLTGKKTYITKININ